MQRLSLRRRNVVSVLTGALILAWSGADAAEPSCLKCHKDQAALFLRSAHAQAGISCVQCHGGNPMATDENAHATDNFKRPDGKKAIAELCASCHSDVRKMNPYGIPADQFERYKTSKHGEQLFGHNDQKVAVCVDCHGVHDILKVKSPQARVFPTNIPQTCGRCHGDAKLMGQYKLPADVVDKYKTSYHAHLLLEKGDLSAPTCVTCHGNHGAMPPGIAEVGQVCGKCHIRQRELFAKSPHAEAAAGGAFSECVSCHSNHGIQKAAVELFSTACVQCHATDPKQLQVRNQVAGLIHRAQTDYQQTAVEVRAATARGLATDDSQLALQEAKTQVTQLEALQHTLANAELQPVAQRFTELIQQTRGDIRQLERYEELKRKALRSVWVFLAVMAVIFWAKRRQLEKQR